MKFNLGLYICLGKGEWRRLYGSEMEMVHGLAGDAGRHDL